MDSPNYEQTSDATRELLDARALSMKPLPDYARRPFSEAFYSLEETIAPMLEGSSRTSFDVTAFYSHRKDGLDEAAEKELYELDRGAYEAALGAGGLIVYFRGEKLNDSIVTPVGSEVGLSFEPNCMSACIWETRKDALSGASVAPHRIAAAGIFNWFNHSGIVKHRLTLAEPGDVSSMAIEQYEVRELF